MQASYQLGLPFAPKPGLSNGRAIPIDTEFDVELAKAIAGLESYNKHLYRPNTYLHKWWARRCGSTFRLILKHLVENEHHHWNPRGWAALTLALKRARFRLLNWYVVHSENPVSVHIANLRALTHDAILVLAPVETETARQWELPAAIDRTDSHRFCESCATALGWMLSADLGDAEIEDQWSRLLEQ